MPHIPGHIGVGGTGGSGGPSPSAGGGWSSPSQPTTVINIVTKPACGPVYDNQSMLDLLNGTIANIDRIPIPGDKNAIVELLQKELLRQLSIAKYIGDSCATDPQGRVATSGTGTGGNIIDFTMPPAGKAREMCEASAAKVWQDSADKLSAIGYSSWQINGILGSKGVAIYNTCKDVATQVPATLSGSR